MNSVVYLFCFFEIAIYNLHRKCIRLDMCNVVRQRLENRCLFQTFMYLNWNLRFHSSLQNWTKTWKKKILKNTKLHFFSMQLFNADAAIFSKNKQIYFLPMTTKKKPSKSAHNRPQTFFSQVQLSCPNQPRIEFSYYKISGKSICSLICIERRYEVASQ